MQFGSIWLWWTMDRGAFEVWQYLFQGAGKSSAYCLESWMFLGGKNGGESWKFCLPQCVSILLGVWYVRWVHLWTPLFWLGTLATLVFSLICWSKLISLFFFELQSQKGRRGVCSLLAGWGNNNPHLCHSESSPFDHQLFSASGDRIPGKPCPEVAWR